MRRSKIFTTFLVLVTFLPVACNSIDYQYIKKNMWQYNSGKRYGDFLIFDSANTFTRHDTLFKRKVPVARIVKLDKNENEIYLEALKDDSTSVYINTDEFRK